jgi:hypothetical protein
MHNYSLLPEKIWEHNEIVFQQFTDLKMAYDLVKREVLYSVSTKSTRGFEKLWRPNKLS